MSTPLTQLDLFRPYSPPVKELPFKQQWWAMHDYVPRPGELTYLPTVSDKLDSTGKLYTAGQIGYIHEISDGKVVVYMPAVYYDDEQTSKACASNWLLLDYNECDPVTMFGFNRYEWEKKHPDMEFPVLRIE